MVYQEGPPKVARRPWAWQSYELGVNIMSADKLKQAFGEVNQ